MNSDIISSEQKKLGAAPTQQPSHPPTLEVYVTETSPTDVLLGRGVDLSRYQGNVDFRQLIQSRINDYVNAKRTGHNKDQIPHEIFNVIVSRNGRFLRKVKTLAEREKLNIPCTETSTAVWVPVSKTVAIDKIKQALRDYDRSGRRTDYKMKFSAFIEPSTTLPTSSTSSKVIQKRKSWSKTAISSTQSSRSVTANDSLESLITQTLQQYQQQQEERRHSLDASVLPLAINESLSTAPSVPPDEANNVKIQHPTAKADNSQLSQVNLLMKTLQYHHVVHNSTQSLPGSGQSPFSANTGVIRDDPFATDRTLPILLKQNLNLALSGQSQSLNCHDISSTLQPQLPAVPIIPSHNTSSSNIDNTISQLLLLNNLQPTPNTILQQQLSTVPLPTDSNRMVQQYLMNDQTNSYSCDRRNLLQQQSDDLPPNVSMQLLNLHQEIVTEMIPSAASTSVTRSANHSRLLSQLISDVMSIPNSQTQVPNDSNSTDTGNNNNNISKSRWNGP